MSARVIKKCPDCNKFRLEYYGTYINEEHWICGYCGYNTVGLNPITVLRLKGNKKSFQNAEMHGGN